MQQFLYSKQSADGRLKFQEPFHVYRREDLVHFDVGFSVGEVERHARYDVDRCLLYVFRTGVAILVVDLSLTSQLLAGVAKPTGLSGRLVNETLTLADAQTLLDLVRRAYTPLFREGNELPHLVVTRARWVRGKGSEGTLHEVAKAAEAVAILIEGERERAPPVFDHWREILPKNLSR